MEPSSPAVRAAPLREVALLFLRLGCTAFGGPAAHIAMMHEEVVRRRGWVSDERFVDLLGVANLIPGPTSTELAIYLGFVRAGWAGLALAGACFIAPAMMIVLALAWGYRTFGALPQARWLFAGVQPVVVAIVAHALWNLRRVALKTLWSLPLLAVIVAAYLLGVNVLAVLLIGAALTGGVGALARWRSGPHTASGGVSLGWLALNHHTPIWRLALARAPLALLAAVAPFTYVTLFLTFLKIGAIVYGSGYVLLAYLRADLVQGLHWLTTRQLLDAVAVGQFTPGPVFTTATFIGYLVGGWPGALVATLAIFLPSFALIAAIRPVAGRLRSSPWTAPVLDGVNVASLALMVGVLAQLAQVALADAISWLVALGALALLLRTRVNPAWLILAGAAIGLARYGLF
ncbi:MAG TPA: chromate efflux transporter [Ktedonobacterales bacterium]|nr:chromate efflux transporter [Ktedonobacterales bacterium]